MALLVLFVACQPTDNSSDEAFKKNSATVKAYLKAFQTENVDYSVFSNDFISRDTGFGGKDTITLAQMKESDKYLFATYDLKLMNFDSLMLLPGVNNITKKPDGSVRYYGDWVVTRPATDSTAAKTGILKAYESFDFDSEGKILFQQIYGDFTGIMTHLNSK
jgi:hypothetical protein